MIFYFSGTGNSKYAAEFLADQLNERCYNICKQGIDPAVYEGGKSIGFVFPVYAWGVPPIVEKFINDLPDSFIEEAKRNDIPVWMIATCGDDTGNTDKMLQRILNRRGLSLKGAWSVIMPNIYVLLPGFDVDSDEVRLAKIKELDNTLTQLAGKIDSEEWEIQIHRGSMPGLKTSVVYPLFRKWGISAKKWHATDKCIGCGICAKECPVNNITIEKNRPVWGHNCLSCVNCYHICPQHAIEYGKATTGKGQYRRDQRPIFSRK